MSTNTLVLFYSYSGNTKGAAKALAKQEHADLLTVKDLKRPGTLKAYSLGCYKAIKGKAWEIAPLAADLNAYEKIFILSPIWAGNAAGNQCRAGTAACGQRNFGSAGFFQRQKQRGSAHQKAGGTARQHAEKH